MTSRISLTIAELTTTDGVTTGFVQQSFTENGVTTTTVRDLGSQPAPKTKGKTKAATKPRPSSTSTGGGVDG